MSSIRQKRDSIGDYDYFDNTYSDSDIIDDEAEDLTPENISKINELYNKLESIDNYNEAENNETRILYDAYKHGSSKYYLRYGIDPVEYNNKNVYRGEMGSLPQTTPSSRYTPVNVPAKKKCDKLVKTRDNIYDISIYDGEKRRENVIVIFVEEEVDDPINNSTTIRFRSYCFLYHEWIEHLLRDINFLWTDGVADPRFPIARMPNPDSSLGSQTADDVISFNNNYNMLTRYNTYLLCNPIKKKHNKLRS
jgi:hypothetical protein